MTTVYRNDLLYILKSQHILSLVQPLVHEWFFIILVYIQVIPFCFLGIYHETRTYR